MEKVASTYRHYLLSVRWIAGEKLLCSPGSPVWCSVMTQGEEGREGEKRRKKGQNRKRERGDRDIKTEKQ